ncbi:MAG: ABC transporter permease [Verrucomicrobiae bacterium]|nr:ABC transporter permease [Verrucomicrobiae bacterium]
MNSLRILRTRLRALFRKGQLEAEMEEEMRAHLELRMQANIEAGMNPEEARFAALRQFGWRESIKDQCREQREGFVGRHLSLICGELRFALRSLSKSPGFTFVAVSSLAVGLALAATTLAMVNAYLIRSLPYPTADRVYHVMYAPPGPYEPRGMTEIDWKSLDDVVEDTISPSSATFYGMDGGSVKTFRGLGVPPGFIHGLGVQAVIGRMFAPEEYAGGAEDVAVIGHEVWRDRFGSDPQVIGRLFRVHRDELAEQTDSLQIVGVLPPGFWFGRDSREKVDVLTPLRDRVRVYMIRLREGVPVASAEKRITEAARSVGSDFRPDWAGVRLESAHDRYVASARPVLVGVSIAVGVVLVLVCANVAVLTLLRALRRQKEVAVRVALGAGWKHIVRMLAAETCLICGAALAAGLALTRATLHWLTPLVETELGRPSPAGPSVVRIDSTVLLALGGMTLVIALSLAFIPLLAPWGRRLAYALRSQGASSTEGLFMRRLRASLIAFEVAGSVVLLVGCGLMIRSAVNLMNTDLGFDPKQVIRVGIRLPARPYAEAPALHRFFTALLERLPQDPGSHVALMNAFPPFYPANTAAFEVGQEETQERLAGLMRVGAGYFNLYNVALRQGREFTASDRLGSQPVAVISETLARRLSPEGGAIGQQIRVMEGDMPGSPPGPWRTVVGVVGDIRQGYDDSDLRDIYLPFLQAPGRFASLHVRTDRAAAFWEQSIRKAAAELDPFVQVGAARTILSEDRQRSGARFLTSMLTGFAAFAALLAVLGIYGVTAYAAQQREREMAIRLAVGANRGSVVRLFLKEGARVLAIGLGFGLLGTFAVVKLLKSQIYGMQPFDVATFVAVFALMATAGALAMWWPARGAALRNPMAVLKEG